MNSYSILPLHFSLLSFLIIFSRPLFSTVSILIFLASKVQSRHKALDITTLSDLEVQGSTPTACWLSAQARGAQMNHMLSLIDWIYVWHYVDIDL